MKKKLFLFFFDEVEKFKGAHEFEYLFIDDGSKDGTLARIKKLASAYPYVRFVSFSEILGKKRLYTLDCKLLQEI